jgi:hypothetical protein
LNSRDIRTPATAASTAALGAALLVVTLAVGPLAVSANAATPLRLASSDATVRVHSAIHLVGSTKPRHVVYLQRFVDGRWRGLTHVRSSATGSYAFAVTSSVRPTTEIFRTSSTPSVAKTSSAASHTVHVRISRTVFTVKAHAAKQVTAGKPLVVTGTVSPRTEGSVRLQVLRGHTWKTLSSAPLSKHSTYTLSATRPAGAYTLRVVKPSSTTVATGASAPQVVSVLGSQPTNPQPTPPSATPARLTVSGPLDGALGLPSSRLVFSAIEGQSLPTPESVTLTNTGGTPASVTGLSFRGSGASSFALAAGQPSSVSVPAGGSATVAVQFTPTAPTSCPTDPNQDGVAAINRDATLSFATSDPALPAGTVAVSGLVACGVGGNEEPTLQQIVQAAGYSDNVIGTGDARYLTAQDVIPGTDEVPAKYLRAADPTKPVTITTVAHYSSPVTSGPYHATGWYAQGAALPADGSCATAACHQVLDFPADPSSTTYNQNQKLWPSTIGPSSFSTSGTFGLWFGDGTDVVFSDDAKNPSSAPHDVRAYPALGPGRVPVANTLIVAVDTGRTGESKNHDYQDLVFVLHNVTVAG